MTSEAAAEHLTPSALGTKEYWDNIYTHELDSHSTNPEDEGTIWFSDSGAEEKVLSYLLELAEDGVLDTERTSFLDLGTGNGHMLFALREDDWHGPMVGVDYSRQSVELAKWIWEEHQREHEQDDENETIFEEWDIMKEPPREWIAALPNGFDCVLDKGTFDAISLSSEVDEQGRRIFERYRDKVEPLVKRGGLLLVTSCNWTEAELRRWLEGGDLEYYGNIEYPTITFQGVKGQTISSVCFRRKSEET